MSTLSAAVSQAITKSLLANLSAAAAEKFSLAEADVKAFLQDFLATQLVKAKGARARRVGSDGQKLPGRVSGYIVFSNENRDAVKKAHPDLKFTETGKELGGMWGKLSDAEKAKYNAKASAANQANGLTPTPAGGKTPAAKSTPAAPAAKKAAGGKAAAAAPAAKKAAAAAPAAKKAAAPAAKKAAAPAAKKAGGRPAKKAAAAHDSDGSQSD